MKCSVSIDLDGLACYYRIHALGAAPAELEHIILERALPRAAALFAQKQINVTWFVIGRDADASSTLPDRATRAANAQRLRTLAERGDELANHSYSHPYDLARQSVSAIESEIANCDRVLRDILAPRDTPKAANNPTTPGDVVQLRKRTEPSTTDIPPMTAPRGFRAPGYDVSPAMLDTLARLNYRYDSSIFPAPGYYAAKAAVMAGLAAVGRPSGAVLTNPRALVAPTEPYRPSMTAPWRRGQAPIVELPIAVTPWTRMPAIGTSLLVAPLWLRARMLSGMAKRKFFNLELHGIDFADAEKDGIPGELVERQPDLQLSVEQKLERLDDILEELRERRDFVTLADIAADTQRDE